MFNNLRKTPGGFGAVGVFQQGDELTIARVHRSRHGVVEVLLCEQVSARDPEALGRLARERGLRGAHGVGVIAPNDYTLLHVDAPEVHPDELNAALRWQVRDMVDFPVDTAVLDAFDQPASTRGEAAHTVNVVVSPQDRVQGHVDLLEALGLRIDAIDIAELALRNLTALMVTEPHGVAVIYLSQNHGLMAFFRDDTLYLSRTVPRGLQDLDGVPGGSDDGAVEEFLTLELQRSLDYYESHFGMPRLARAVILPHTPATADLAVVLGEQTGMDCGPFDPGAHLVWARGDGDGVPGPCYLAVGGALRGLGEGR